MTPAARPAGVARMAEGLACAAVGGLLLLALATTVDIAMRYLFARPIRGFVEISALAGAVLLAACMPHLLVARANIAVDALGSKLGGRWHPRLDAFGAAMTAAFFTLMAWQYILFAAELRGTGQAIPVLRWAAWPWWAAVAAMVCAAAICAWGTLRRDREGAAG